MHQLLPREIIISTNPSVFNACACTSSLKFIRLYSIGDCDAFNAKYPGCKAWPSSVENGYCDPDANTEECKYDGGEFVKHPDQIFLHQSTVSNLFSDYPGDCDAFNEEYPGCKAWPDNVGNGECDADANNEECKFDGGEFVRS